MFIGHYATGLVFYLKKPAGKLTFFLLVLGTQFVDLLWGLFTLIGIEGGFSNGSVEHNYFDIPWSHSLLMMIVWSLVYGYSTNYYLSSKDVETKNFGLIAGLSVFSHWILDFIVHNDDMRILPTSDTTVPSLYLWEFPIIAFILEFAIIIISWFFYWKYLQNNTTVVNPNKIYGMLGLLSILHVIGFLPSFTNGDGAEVESFMGLVVMIMITSIAFGMTWLHPDKTIEKQNEKK